MQLSELLRYYVLEIILHCLGVRTDRNEALFRQIADLPLDTFSDPKLINIIAPLLNQGTEVCPKIVRMLEILIPFVFESYTQVFDQECFPTPIWCLDFNARKQKYSATLLDVNREDSYRFNTFDLRQRFLVIDEFREFLWKAGIHDLILREYLCLYLHQNGFSQLGRDAHRKFTDDQSGILLRETNGHRQAGLAERHTLVETLTPTSIKVVVTIPYHSLMCLRTNTERPISPSFNIVTTLVLTVLTINARAQVLASKLEQHFENKDVLSTMLKVDGTSLFEQARIPTPARSVMLPKEFYDLLNQPRPQGSGLFTPLTFPRQ